MASFLVLHSVPPCLLPLVHSKASRGLQQGQWRLCGSARICILPCISMLLNGALEGEHDFFKKNWNHLLKSIHRLNRCREEMKRFAGELRSQMLMNFSLVSLQVQKTTAAQRFQLSGKFRLRLSVRQDQNQQGQQRLTFKIKEATSV